MTVGNGEMMEAWPLKERMWPQWAAWVVCVVIATGAAVESPCLEKLKPDKALVQHAMAVSWTKGNEKKLRAIFDRPSKVGQLIYTLDEENLIPYFLVGSFHFADLLGDGSLELVANIDMGRAFFNELVIIHQGPNGFVTESLDGWNFEEIPKHLVHLSADGRTQILVDELMEPYAGYHLVPTFTHVYDWNGTKFVQSDGAYKDWYAKVRLPELRRELKEEKGKGPEERDPEMLHAVEMEMRAVEKLLKTP